MRKTVLFLMGALLVLSMSGCGAKKYEVLFDKYGFESEKTKYEPGEEVTVYYGIIATDTDYSFHCDDDVEMKTGYDDSHGYVMTFTMPEHDVTLSVSSRNTMEYDPDAYYPDVEDPETIEEDFPDDLDDSGETWYCPECGQKNTGDYCMDCGLKKP